jgi:arginine/lysine/ornithine decarboxylase
MTATAAPVHDGGPFLDALRGSRERGMMSFSCPGHKGGQGAAGDVRALLGDGVFVYVAPRVHPELGVGLGVAADDVAAAHARGVPVYVDEAWGPHLGFHPALPPGAMAAGADGAVTSTHKFLSSLSQTSLLNLLACRRAEVHICGPADPTMDRVAVVDGS